MVWAASAAFLTYFCMYAFRKPLSAAVFEGQIFLGISYKVCIIITQVVGYLCAKWFGIHWIAELKPQNRRKKLLFLIGVSHVALLLFALTPAPYNIVWIFFNGFPLGLIWGIVFSYIEGRRITDILATFLSISFIVGSGVVKSVGRALIEKVHIPEYWMPFCVGALFFPLILLTSWMLEKIAPPDSLDIAERSPRIPLNPSQRKELYWQFGLGLNAILILNVVMTIVRDTKDNFLVEIFKEIGIGNEITIYTQTESLIGIIVIVVLSSLVFIRAQKKAFYLLHFLMFTGMCIVGASTYLYAHAIISGFYWIILHGIGLYVSYIVFQSLYFERWIAAFRLQANVGFFMYIFDFLGYIGSCAIIFLKEIAHFSTNWERFLIQLSYGASCIAMICIATAFLYFHSKLSQPSNS